MSEQQKKQVERQKVEIEMDPIPLDPALVMSITTTHDLGRAIGKLFRSISNEALGVNIVLTPRFNGIQWAFNLYLAPNTAAGNGKIQLLKDVYTNATGQTDVLRTLSKINATTSPNRYMLTDDAKDIFEKWMFVSSYKNGKPEINWTADVSEVSDDLDNGRTGIKNTASRICVKMDLVKLLPDLYGKFDPENPKNNYEYQVLLRNEVANSSIGNLNFANVQQGVQLLDTSNGNLWDEMSFARRNWFIEINKLNTEAVKNLAAKYAGGTISRSSIPMIPATDL